MTKKEFITLNELRKKLYMISNNIDYEIFTQHKMIFKKISNLIKRINYYDVENKYD